MQDLLKNGYHAKKRPSGHDISKKFAIDNGAAIPPNLIASANTESNSFYLRYCRERGIEAHPARYPSDIPEYFIRMLTDPGDFVIDPFAGSCVTGEVSERLKRHWACIEVSKEYLEGAIGRFVNTNGTKAEASSAKEDDEEAYYYKLARPGTLWNGIEGPPLPSNGGQTRTAMENTTDKISTLHQQTDSDAPADFYYDAPHPHTLWKGVEETPLADDEWEQPDDLDTPSLEEESISQSNS